MRIIIDINKIKDEILSSLKNKITSKKILLSLIFINISFYILFIIIEGIVNKNGFEFREWLNNLFYINFICLICNSIFLLIRCVKFKILKILLSLVLIVVVVEGIFLYSFGYKEEYEIYKNNEKLLVVVTSWLDTTVDYYYPINKFIRKKLNIKSEKFSGCIDPYKK